MTDLPHFYAFKHFSLLSSCCNFTLLAAAFQPPAAHINNNTSGPAHSDMQGRRDELRCVRIPCSRAADHALLQMDGCIDRFNDYSVIKKLGNAQPSQKGLWLLKSPTANTDVWSATEHTWTYQANLVQWPRGHRPFPHKQGLNQKMDNTGAPRPHIPRLQGSTLPSPLPPTTVADTQILHNSSCSPPAPRKLPDTYSHLQGTQEDETTADRPLLSNGIDPEKPERSKFLYWLINCLLISNSWR